MALCLLLTLANMARADELQDANRYFKQGQHALALEKVESFLKSKPKDAQARFLKGLILTEQGKTTEAIKVFSALTDDYPELPEPYNNLAVLFAGQGQYEKAKVALEMAIRTHPSYATAHENLGDIYAKMASQAYDRALQLDRSNTSTQTKLEMIKDLFGSNRGGRSNVASQNAVTAIVSPNKPTPMPVVVKPNVVVALPAASKPQVVVHPPTVEKPVVAPKPVPTNNVEDEVARTLHDWAAAWSAKNVKKYLAFYAKEFKAPDGLARTVWETQREERINKPKSIRVAVSEFEVKKLDSTHVNVSFRQSYQATHMHTSTVKTIRMVKTGSRWQIADEHVGK